MIICCCCCCCYRQVGAVCGVDSGTRIGADHFSHFTRTLLRHHSAVEGRLHLYQDAGHCHHFLHLDHRITYIKVIITIIQLNFYLL